MHPHGGVIGLLIQIGGTSDLGVVSLSLPQMRSMNVFQVCFRVYYYLKTGADSLKPALPVHYDRSGSPPR